MRPRRDLYAIYATCSRPARDLYATYTRLARSGRDLGAIWARSVCDLALSPGVSDCRRAAGFRRTSPRLQTVQDCCRVPSHFHRPKSPSNLIRRYALNSLEVVLSVAEWKKRCRKVSPMSRWCRNDVAIVSPDVAMVSPDVAVVSRWCRKCRAAVTRCRHDNFFKYPHGFGGLSRGPTPPPTLWPSTRR